jgi:hypothetical protein
MISSISQRGSRFWLVGTLPSSSLYLTDDPLSGMVNFYHARYLSKGKKSSRSASRRRSTSRRKSSITRLGLEDPVEHEPTDYSPWVFDTSISEPEHDSRDNTGDK